MRSSNGASSPIPRTPGTLRVRASIKNLADFAQPYPLLKLVLEDRWGEQVRAREFEPAEYLDPTYRARSPAGARRSRPTRRSRSSIPVRTPKASASMCACAVQRGPVCAADVPER